MTRDHASKPPHPARLYKLLGQVVKYYRRRFVEESRARQYLAERGITDKQALEIFQVGYCDGTLRDVLPFDDQVHADLRTLGILKDNGQELLVECVVFPLWSFSKVPVNLYGRRLFDSDVPHLYLPGARRGLLNWQAAKRNAELVLAESVIDALSLYVAGVHSAVPCYGTAGFTQDHEAMLRRFRPSKIAVCFDGDPSGKQAAEKLAVQLHGQRRGKAAVRIVTLEPNTDANALLVAQGPEVLRQAVDRSTAPPFDAPAPPTVEEALPAVAGSSEAMETAVEDDVLHRAGRRYEVKAISHQGTQLRVTLKASKPDGVFELATIDLYSHRSRQWFAGLCATLFGVEVQEAQEDLQSVLAHVERRRNEGRGDDKGTARIEVPETDKAEALELLGDPKLMERLLGDLEYLGYAGEVVNKQLGYLVAISRKLERPLSLLIESRSGAGKSALQDAVLSCVPEEECLKYSRITDQALFYTQEDGLEGKLLVIEEAAGMGGGAYSIRALQSGDELRVAATGKDPATGRMKTEEYSVKTRTAVMMTTTQPDFDEETKSRFICATVDETAAMTRQILEVQRQAETLEGIALRRRAQRIQRVHQNAQRLLQSVTVANPYAPKLTFPSHTLAARRDNKKYLGLIKAVALLHQHQRPRKKTTVYGEEIDYIEVTLPDIAVANQIARTVLVANHADVTPQGRRLFALVRKMLVNSSGDAATGEASFSRRRLREHSGWSDWQIRTHLSELVELEYLQVRQGKGGKEYLYELSDTQLLESLPGFGLTDLEALGHELGDGVRVRRPQSRRNPEVNPANLEAI